MAYIKSTFPGLSPPSRRAGRLDLRDDGRNRGKCPQDWRRNEPLNRPHRQGEAHRGHDAGHVTLEDMMAELKEDDLALTQRMRRTHNVCDERGDVVNADACVSLR
jgi:hypothetical protein